MSVIQKRVTKPFETNKENLSSQKEKNRFSENISSPIDHFSFLQRTIGNQAVQRLFLPGVIQAKLRIGQPNDIYEQEADRIAEQIMRMPGPMIQAKTSCPLAMVSPCGEEEVVQTKPLRITPLMQRQTEQEKAAQAKGNSGQTRDGGPELELKISNLRGGGQPLPQSVRSFFEPHFGWDFSGVRVHNDSFAVESARTLNARAYTLGRDIVFGAGRYAPETGEGKKLLTHELTHVVQQGGTTSARTILRREEPGAPVAPAGAIPAPVNAPRASTGRPSPDNRTGHDIYVIDFGVNQDVVNWREAIFHIGEIEAESVDQMVRDVKAEVGDPSTNCIRRLTLDGHGSPGNMSVGDGTGWMEGRNISAGNFRPSLAELTPYFCSGASVVLLGCNVGRGPTGMRFIQALADYWQVNVAAATGKVDGFGIQGVWVWGLPGQVLPNDTMLIVDQIIRILDETTYGDDEEMIFEILEAADARGSLTDVRSELVRRGRWYRLCRDLRDEDSTRFNRLYPGEPTPTVTLKHPSEIEIPPPWTRGSGSIF